MLHGPGRRTCSYSQPLSLCAGPCCSHTPPEQANWAEIACESAEHSQPPEAAVLRHSPARQGPYIAPKRESSVLHVAPYSESALEFPCFPQKENQHWSCSQKLTGLFRRSTGLVSQDSRARSIPSKAVGCVLRIGTNQFGADKPDPASWPLQRVKTHPVKS